MPHLREHGYEAGHHDETVVAVHARVQAGANRADEPRTRIDRWLKPLTPSTRHRPLQASRRFK